MSGAIGLPSVTRRAFIRVAITFAGAILAKCGVAYVSHILRPAPDGGWREIAHGWGESAPDDLVKSEAMFEDEFLSVYIVTGIPFNGVGLVGPVVPVIPVGVGNIDKVRFYFFIERKSNDVDVNLNRLEISPLKPRGGGNPIDYYTFDLLPALPHPPVHLDVHISLYATVDMRLGPGDFDGCILHFSKAIRTSGGSIPDLRLEMRSTADAGIFSASSRRATVNN